MFSFWISINRASVEVDDKERLKIGLIPLLSTNTNFDNVLTFITKNEFDVLFSRIHSRKGASFI